MQVLIVDDDMATVDVIKNSSLRIYPENSYRK